MLTTLTSKLKLKYNGSYILVEILDRKIFLLCLTTFLTAYYLVCHKHMKMHGGIKLT